MKLSVSQQDLLTIIKFANRTVEKRNTIPILGNVLLTASQDKLSIKATDLDIQIETSAACNVTRTGSATVLAEILLQIVSKLKTDSEISIEYDPAKEPTCAVRSGRSRFKLQTLPTADFPDLSGRLSGKTEHRFELARADLDRLLFRSKFCIATDETRYYLNGVYFHHISENGEKLRSVATDGHRLAQIQCDAPEGSTTFEGTETASGVHAAGVILPRKTIDVVNHIMSIAKTEKIGIQLSESKIIFNIGDTIITSKLIDGQFPDYQRVVPRNNDLVATMDRVEVLGAVDRLSVLSTDERGKSLQCSFAGQNLTLSVVNPDAGNATEEIDIEYNGTLPLDIGFNSKYVKEILERVEGDKVEFRLADAGSPALIMSPTTPDALYVAMPMRI